ncbi:hypothetical protein [Endozoicomonas sp.]|uniref:hypothetical protein n=1 Tax=Endozoicomonas sp. TaxID=1892382 RepID=UPI00383A2D18
MGGATRQVISKPVQFFNTVQQKDIPAGLEEEKGAISCHDLNEMTSIPLKAPTPDAEMTPSVCWGMVNGQHLQAESGSEIQESGQCVENPFTDSTDTDFSPDIEQQFFCEELASVLKNESLLLSDYEVPMLASIMSGDI